MLTLERVVTGIQREQSRGNSFWVWLSLILAMQVLLAVTYANKVPLWMPSDERAHADYLIDLVQKHTFHPYVSHDPRYEAYQPPLYYFLCMGLCKVFAITTQNHQAFGLAVRLFSAGIGLFTSLVLALLLRCHTKFSNGVILSTVACYAWSPVILAITSTISNDGMLYFWSVCAVAIAFGGDSLLFSCRQSLLLGVVLGLGLLAKSTFFPIIPAILACYWYQKREQANWINIASLILPIALLVTPWLIWNWNHYHALTAVQLHIADQTEIGFINSPARLRGFIASMVAYHFVPCEFWLNQFKVPLPMQGLLVLSFVGTLAHAVVALKPAIKDRSKSASFATFGALFYIIALVFYMGLGISFRALPVRDFFGAYYAFCFFLNGLVIGSMAAFIDRRLPRMQKVGTLKFAVVPTFFLLLNLWLMTKVGILQSFGLQPFLFLPPTVQ